MSARTQGTPADCFVWEVPGKPIAVHLNYDVVDRILPDVLRGFAAVPKRGAEVGGILLGSATQDGDKTVVHVRDCELVPCEYKHGPSYLLSDGDLEAFDDSLAKWEAAPGGVGPVGFYRSHTRENLSPEEDDLDLCANFFPGPSNILLLIKPHNTRPSTAGFFFYENGRFQPKSYLEFPFRRRELSGQGPEVRRPLGERLPAGGGERELTRKAGLARLPEPIRPAAPEVREPEPVYVEERPAVQPVETPQPEAAYIPISAPRTRFKWVWIPLSFIFLLMGVVLGFQTALSWSGRAGAAGPEAYALGLVIRRSGENLSVRWDPSAPAVKLSKSGILDIEVNGEHQAVDLDASLLQTGSIIYRNSGNPAKFRLDVFPRDGSTVSESTSWRRE